ncbi:MAG TPA: aldose 1-epimerase [Puia sp.]|nr:aldose 1-epimerase [Puia sp.]
MSFSIRNSKEHDLDLVNIIDETTGTVVSLLPAYGATLQAFTIRHPREGALNVIDSYKSAAEVKKEMSKSFKGPKLSPFPCRIPDGMYRYNNHEYRFKHLFGDGNAIHGLLYNKPFTLMESGADNGHGTVVLECIYKREDPGYPFYYACSTRYILHPGNDLEVVTTITNLDDETIPIADGWHPYFALGGKTDQWQLMFHAEAIVEFDKRLVPTGRLQQYDRFESLQPIGDAFLDNCFALKPDIASAACQLYNPANGLRISFFPDATYPYLQIYTPPTRDSIAVENLSGAPDCFNNHMGLVLLQPGHSQIFTVRYKITID